MARTDERESEEGERVDFSLSFPFLFSSSFSLFSLNIRAGFSLSLSLTRAVRIENEETGSN